MGTSTSPAKAFALYGKTLQCRQKSGSKSFYRGITVITCRLCSFKSWNAQHGNRSCCCSCSDKEIYLSTAKIAPSLRNFLTPCVPVRHGIVGSIVVPKGAALYAVRTRRRAESCLFYGKIRFLFAFYFLGVF